MPFIFNAQVLYGLGRNMPGYMARTDAPTGKRRRDVHEIRFLRLVNG